MATTVHPAHHHHHHHPANMHPLLLGLVLIAATIAAITPFAIVIAGMQYGIDDDNWDWILAAIAAFIVLFPIAIRVLTPAHDRDRDREILEDHETAHQRELRENSLLGRHV